MVERNCTTLPTLTPGDPDVGLATELDRVVELRAQPVPWGASGIDPPKEIHRNNSSPTHDATNATIVRIRPSLAPDCSRDAEVGQKEDLILLQSGAFNRSSSGPSGRVGVAQPDLEQVQPAAGRHEQATDYRPVRVLCGGQAVGDVAQPRAPEQVALPAVGW